MSQSYTQKLRNSSQSSTTRSPQLVLTINHSIERVSLFRPSEIDHHETHFDKQNYTELNHETYYMFYFMVYLSPLIKRYELTFAHTSQPIRWNVRMDWSTRT